MTESKDDPVVKRLEVKPTGSGPLDGLTFGVKDLFDVQGEVTGFGNPDWARTHAAAKSHAWIVSALLEQGARAIAKTATVELAFGLEGSNAWYGTPPNPAAPDRLPGGSSSGSASLVASGGADFALGSDTGGSVRIPASYCGLYGLRPTQGMLSLQGAAPLAPSFDTPGWFTRDAETFRRIGEALLPPSPPLNGPFLLVNEAWENAEPATREALAAKLDHLGRKFGTVMRIDLAPEGLDAFAEARRILQGREAWAALGGWIEAENANLGPITKARFAAAAAITAAQANEARAFRRHLQHRLDSLLAQGAVLIFPTSPSPAPRRDASTAATEAVRTATQRPGAISALAGIPEMTIPLATAEGAPVGLSLVAARGRDLALIELAARLERP